MTLDEELVIQRWLERRAFLGAATLCVLFIVAVWTHWGPA